MVNGVAMEAAPKVTVMLGSDGSQMEGDDAEAARLAVAQNLPVKLFLDDNDVTIAGHPSQDLKNGKMARDELFKLRDKIMGNADDAAKNQADKAERDANNQSKQKAARL